MDGDNLDFGADLSMQDWFLIDEEVQSPAPSQAHVSLHVSPKCKASPLAAPVIRQCLSRSRTETRVSGTPQLGGLAAPSRPQPTFSSRVPDSTGLQVPHLHHVVPRSLMLDTDTSSVEQGTRVDFPLQPLPRASKRPRGAPKLAQPGQSSSRDITRARRASDSGLVMSLWGSVVKLYATFSPLLEQIQSSSFYQQHSQRLVDSYAASTLIKYLMALQTFYQLAVDMRLDLSNLSELQLADILVAGKLSKHSTDAGASHSMLIKAIRWGFKQLQLDCFSVAFGSLISSFQSKIPHDRKESLPFSLYIMSQFERHILVRETPMAEILVLGAFLLLLFSGLRYADLQRTSPQSLHWDGKVLRGLAWRTKTSSAGTPFGALACGFLSKGSFNWLHKFLVHLDDVLALHGDSSIDFLIPSIGPEGLRVPPVPMSYAEGLYFLRKYIALPWKKQPLDIGTSPSSYTIHGLKSTMISWATQLDLSDEHK